VVCLSVDYGQRHSRELKAAKLLTDYYNVDHFVADLASVRPLFSGSSQTSANVKVPHGHYTHESMKATVVPNRNMVLLSLAAAWAESLQYTHVAYAAHAGDHAIYPDCRMEFVGALEAAIGIATEGRIQMYAPYIHISKTDIVCRGLTFNVPYELTWTCYEGGDRPCGKCGTCVERLEAFRDNNAIDLLTYREE
jgi:7-cyano-7-deazaguanine synthase